MSSRKLKVLSHLLVFVYVKIPSGQDGYGKDFKGVCVTVRETVK